MPKTAVRVFAKDVPPGQYDTDLTPEEANALIRNAMAEKYRGDNPYIVIPFTDPHGQLVNTYIDMAEVVTVVVIPPTHVSTALH